MSTTQFTVEPGTKEIVITRDFDAPRELVYKAYTDPTMIPLWWGPRQYKTVVDKMDVRPGGAWRFVQTDPDGNEFAFHGEYLEVEPPHRVVGTFEFEGMPGHVLRETATLEEIDGKTRLTTVSVFDSVEERDGMVASGMESGATDSMERLGELLAELLAKAPR
jgi:uncharacterized protein YndB with AHSA1/START domain